MKFVTIIAALLMSASAFGVEAEAWKCDLEIRAEGYRVGVFFGVQSISGEGELTCVQDSTYGYETRTLPVFLEIGGFNLGFSNVNIESVDFRAYGVGLHQPEDFYGKYRAGVQAGASLDPEGGEVDAVFSVNEGRGAGFEVSASRTVLSRRVRWLPLVDVFAGIKAMSFCQEEGCHSVDDDEEDFNTFGRR